MPGSSNGGVVLFLDVDGVLLGVPETSLGGGDLDSGCLKRLKEICTHTNPQPTVVLSSEWRKDAEKINRLQAAFDALGQMPVIAGGVPDGVPSPTAVTYLKKDLNEQKLVRDRVDEIFAWLAANTEKYPFAASRWLAIDDLDLSVDDRMKNHFIKTDTADGLASADVMNAKQLVDAFPAFAPTPAAGASSTGGELPLGAPLTGIVKRYNATRGFGFITSNTNPPVDIFVHQSSVKMNGFRGLNVGAEVDFVAAHDGKKLQATEVMQRSQYIPHLNGVNVNTLARDSTGMVMPVTQPNNGGAPARGGRGRGNGGGRGGAGRGAMPPWMMPMIPDGAGWRAANGTVFYAMPGNEGVVDPNQMPMPQQ